LIRRFNITHLLENGKRIIPLDLIIDYRFNILTDKEVKVLVWGVTNNAGYTCLGHQDLYKPVDPYDTTVFTNDFNTDIFQLKIKIVTGLFIEIENVEYVEIKRIAVTFNESSKLVGRQMSCEPYYPPIIDRNYNVNPFVFLMIESDRYNVNPFTFVESDEYTVNPFVFISTSSTLTYNVNPFAFISSTEYNVNPLVFVSTESYNVNPLVFVETTVYSVNPFIHISYEEYNVNPFIYCEEAVVETGIYLQDIDDLWGNLDKSITLTRDLDFNDDASYRHSDVPSETSIGWEAKKLAWTTGEGWTPLGQDASTGYYGTFDGAGHTIKNLFVGNPTYSYDKRGSLVSYNEGIVKNLAVHGNIDAPYAAMITNFNSGTIENCYAYGTIVDGSSSEDRTFGGIVGYNAYGTVTNCYAYVEIPTGALRVGGLIGEAEESTITNSYYDSDVSNQSDTGKGEPRTTAQMKTLSNYIGWDFTNIWQIEEGVTYPMFL